jgi:hypothetical protein
MCEKAMLSPPFLKHHERQDIADIVAPVQFYQAYPNLLSG